jgi:hypothetical protein
MLAIFPRCAASRSIAQDGSPSKISASSTATLAAACCAPASAEMETPRGGRAGGDPRVSVGTRAGVFC